ncbi:hypothetical protein [Frigoribacterium sp. CFBP 13707]|uniref:hypothetical protein n=1 Tax=Frigoribacterium sp. CFBP 13707 TaxID=2775313 RepID=UPI0017821FA3|nr:hypothetical protein [Frigoribacterium sp. CFBP 13707]MBD8729039.1 hypothetical protein [Frigoribacterium sp. CFBP 13707]
MLLVFAALLVLVCLGAFLSFQRSSKGLTPGRRITLLAGIGVAVVCVVIFAANEFLV